MQITQHQHFVCVRVYDVCYMYTYVHWRTTIQFKKVYVYKLKIHKLLLYLNQMVIDFFSEKTIEIFYYKVYKCGVYSMTPYLFLNQFRKLQ